MIVNNIVKTNENNEDTVYIVNVKIVDEMIDYIEKCEQKIDSEWGESMDIESLKRDEDMPDIYYKLIDIKKGFYVK